MKPITLAATFILATSIATPAFAQSSFEQFLEDTGIEANFDTVSEYVFRGQSRGAQSIASETVLTIPYGFSFGSTYIAGVDPDSDVQRDEIRAFANYSVPLDDAITVDVGATYFYYPQFGGFFETRGGSAGSYEAYGSVGLDEVFLKPKGKIYYDFTLDNLTLEGSIAHSFELPREGWTANLGLTGGYVDGDNSFVGVGTVLDYGYGTASAGLNKVITQNISFYVDGKFTVNTEDDTLNFDRALTATGVPFATRDSSTKFWLGTGLALNF